MAGSLYTKCECRPDNHCSTYFLADAAAAGALHPRFFNVDGNTGTKNSFSGVNVPDLRGGLFDSASLAQCNNFACFAMQFAVQAKPDVALGALTQLTNALGPITSALGCPQLTSVDEAQLERLPGYPRSTKDGITK